jgi:hypothetical protein
MLWTYQSEIDDFYSGVFRGDATEEIPRNFKA